MQIEKSMLPGKQYKSMLPVGLHSLQGVASHCKDKTISWGSSNEKPPFLLLLNQTSQCFTIVNGVIADQYAPVCLYNSK